MVEFAIPDRGVLLPDVGSASDRVGFAERVESAGIGGVWTWDGWSYSPFGLLNRVAERTDLALGTAIANVHARSPSALAMEALSLHEATDGRFVLGVGASTPPVVESFHGATYDRVLRCVRETIEVVRLALAGDPIDYDGDLYDLSGFSLDGAPVDVPILNAALGPTNVALSIDHADGIVPNLVPFDAIDDALAAGKERANSTIGDDFRVVPSIPVAVSEDPEEARSVLSQHVAFYVGATDPYHAAVSRGGFAGEAESIREAWEAGERDAAATAVTEDLLDAVGIVGTPERARKRVRSVLSGRIDGAVFELHGTNEMIDAGLLAVAP